MADDIIPMAERANREVFREVVRRTGGRIVDADGILLIHGPHPSWVISNGAFRTDPGLPAESTIARVVGSFGELGRRPTLTTFERVDGDLDDAVRRAGWTMAIELPVMVREAPLPVRPVTRATLRWLDAGDPRDLAGLRDVLRRGFAEDDEERGVVDSLLAGPASIAPPGVDAVVATLGDAWSASAMAYRVGDAAVVGWVATVPEARRRGLGRLATAAVANRGLEGGAAWVTLQASPMGLPVYASMGFETVTTSRVWIGPQAED
jgi:GNAT superfamily N-acetyltransferase